MRALHKAHDVASIRSLMPRLHYFDQGTCIVHHMFGAEVTQHVRDAYPDALLTAHFEVRWTFLVVPSSHQGLAVAYDPVSTRSTSRQQN